MPPHHVTKMIIGSHSDPAGGGPPMHRLSTEDGELPSLPAGVDGMEGSGGCVCHVAHAVILRPLEREEDKSSRKSGCHAYSITQGRPLISLFTKSAPLQPEPLYKYGNQK